jgi:hypothetical protein
VTIAIRVRLVDVFDLPDKRQRLFRALGADGKCRSFGVGCKGEIVVVAILKIIRSTLGMAPDSILQNVIPDVTTPSFARAG